MQNRKRLAQNKPLLSLAAGLVLVALSLFGFWWLGRGESPTPNAGATGNGPGQTAPDFVLRRTDGQAVRLSDLRGQVVIVNLWASWCPPCRAEMPDLVAVYQAYQGEGLVILGVNDQEQKEKVDSFLARNPLPYPVLLDTDSRVARAYGVNYLPASFVVDRRGVLRATLPGQSTRAQLEAAIKPLLAEKPR